MAVERVQFGMMCKLEFTNFTTKKKFTIDQSLRISFEFFKSFDEGNTASTGEIVIYGLTEETAYKLGTRIGDMFQTEVRCDVGYSGDPDNVQTLFYATVMNNSWRPVRGTSETRIRVSANFRDFHLGKVASVQKQVTTYGEIFDSINSNFGYFFSFWLYDLEQSSNKNIGEDFSNIEVLNWSFTGTLGEYLNKIYNAFGIIHNVDNQEKHVQFRIHPKFIPYYVKVLNTIESSNNTLRVDASLDSDGAKAKTSNSADYRTKEINSLYSTSDDKTAIVLGWDTGLLELPTIDNRNVVVPYTQTLGANETIEKRKGIEAVIDKKTGEQKVDKDGNLKFKKPPKTMTINRRFLTAKALINPSILPNGQVRINTGSSKTDGLYRVRNCAFSGDTHEGDWSVEMELEDTTDNRAEVKSSLPSEQEETIEVINNESNDIDVGE